MFRNAIFLGALAHAVLVAQAGELTGVVRDQEYKPVAGATVKLLFRGDSTLTDAAGGYRLPLRALAIERRDAHEAIPHLRGGELRFQARAGERVRLEAFDSRGRKAADRSWPAARDGVQGAALAGVTDGLRGLGWLRLTLAGGTRVLRVVDAGHGVVPMGAGNGTGVAARRAASDDPVDSLRVSKAGYYDVKTWLFSVDEKSRDFMLWRNSIHGLPPAEVEAWKQHLRAETYTLSLSKSLVTTQFVDEEFSLVLADGTVASEWKTDPCDPGAPPRSVRFAYSQGGTLYRDTIALAPFWAFFDSLKATRDSVGPYWSEYRVNWSLPETLSALPERDRMALRIGDGQYGDTWRSEPDVFQQGVLHGIEGGTQLYGAFSPRAGWDTLHSIASERVDVEAWLTRARRPGHILAIQLNGQARIEPVPKVAFRNAWPAANSLRKGQSIEMEVAREGKVDALILEWRPGGTSDDYWKQLGVLPRGQSKITWAFKQPLRSPTSVQFRLREEQWRFCGAKSVSPILTVTPDPADSLVAAFEPNENPGQAVLVPRGAWLSAGWDYRGPSSAEDADFYRFPAARGETVRFSLANPDSGEVLLHQECGGPASGIVAEAGKENSFEVDVEAAGDCWFQLRPLEEGAHTYRFRVESVP